MTTLREAAQAARDALKAVYGSACQGEIGVLDVAATCRGGVYTLWDRVKATAASLDAALAQPEPCHCGDRPKAQCPGEWEQGCDLGSNPKYARAVPVQPKPKRPDVDAVMALADEYHWNCQQSDEGYASRDPEGTRAALRAAVEAMAQPEPTVDLTPDEQAVLRKAALGSGKRLDAQPEPVTEVMTLRDYFAAEAMCASVATGSMQSEKTIAECAYRYADAMLWAREKE